MQSLSLNTSENAEVSYSSGALPTFYTRQWNPLTFNATYGALLNRDLDFSLNPNQGTTTRTEFSPAIISRTCNQLLEGLESKTLPDSLARDLTIRLVQYLPISGLPQLIQAIRQIYEFNIETTTISELLREALLEAIRLPATDQNAIASVVLDEIAAERRWIDLLDRSGDVLDEMIANALAEDDAGETLPLDPDTL